MRRDHVASTLIRRHFNVVCPLGLFCNGFFHNSSVGVWEGFVTVTFPGYLRLYFLTDDFNAGNTVYFMVPCAFLAIFVSRYQQIRFCNELSHSKQINSVRHETVFRKLMAKNQASAHIVSTLIQRLPAGNTISIVILIIAGDPFLIVCNSSKQLDTGWLVGGLGHYIYDVIVRPSTNIKVIPLYLKQNAGWCFFFSKYHFSFQPASVAQSGARLTGDCEVAMSIRARFGNILSQRLIIEYFLQ